MKKVTIKDLNGKELEVYYASDNIADSTIAGENQQKSVEDFDINKEWFHFTGGSDHPLDKHDEGQMYNIYDDAEQIVGLTPKGYKEEGKGKVWAALTESFLNKVKLQESGSQIKVKIDDTIPSDFVDTADLHLGSIYMVAGLGLTAKFVSQIIISENKTLLQMKRHGTVFYVEEGQLLKAMKPSVEDYLNEPF